MNVKRICLIIALLLTPVLAGAQDEPTTEDVIDMVIEGVPEIADGLNTLTDYEVLAYNSNNAYGIWQVEFKDIEGNDLAWAQVRPSTGKIYAWDAYFGATDDAYDAILPIYQEFVANHPDVRELIRGINPDDIYPWWDGGEQAWVTWIGDAGDAIMVAVRFEGGLQTSTENPELTGIWFPNLPSYNEWWVASSSQAVALAFQEVEIAIALRGKQWTTESALADEADTNVWTVNFMADGEMVATATVNVADGEILAYEILA